MVDISALEYERLLAHAEKRAGQLEKIAQEYQRAKSNAAKIADVESIQMQRPDRNDNPRK